MFPEDFNEAYDKLPQVGDAGTADPLWVVYDKRVILSEADIREMTSDERLYCNIDAEYEKWHLEATNEPITDKWLLDNGYGVEVKFFYGAYLTKEAAEKAVKQRRYAFHNPEIYCESLVYSDPALRWFVRAHREHLRKEMK